LTEGGEIEPNNIYIIPPNVQLEIADSRFKLTPGRAGGPYHQLIDVFFRSLASFAGPSAVGVVLSGTAEDGAAGLRDIQANGGITIVQTPETAKYDGMPRAAIAADGVDLILPPGQIGRELVSIGKHGYFSSPPAVDGQPEVADSQLTRIFTMLRGSTGV